MEDLNETKIPFYDIYDLKREEIPSEEEWALRMKEVGPDQLREPLWRKPSDLQRREWGQGDEVNVKVTTKASVVGAVEKDAEQKERDFIKLQKLKRISEALPLKTQKTSVVSLSFVPKQREAYWILNFGQPI